MLINSRGQQKYETELEDYSQLFRILVGGTGRNVPPSFCSVPGFSNDPWEHFCVEIVTFSHFSDVHRWAFLS